MFDIVDRLNKLELNARLMKGEPGSNKRIYPINKDEE